MYRNQLTAYMLTGCLSVAIWACQDEASRITCLDHAVEVMMQDEDSRRLLSAFRDTMQAWNTARLRPGVWYYHHLVKIDAVLIDSARRRGIIVALEIDTSEGAEFNHVQIYGAERISGAQYFYSFGLPSLGVIKPSELNDYTKEFSMVSMAWKPMASDDEYFDCANLKMREKFFDELLHPKRQLKHDRFNHLAY